MTEFKEQSLETFYIDEPDLGFGHGQAVDHPKDGLTLYGPQARPNRKQITIGVIGTSVGIDYFRNWMSGLMKGVSVPPPTKREKKERLHLSSFPGLEEAFGIYSEPDDLISYELSADAIAAATVIENHHEAVSKTVQLYIDLIVRHGKNEERQVDVWVMVVPELVFDRCRPQMGGKRKATLTPGEFSKNQKSRTDAPLFAGIFEEADEQIFDDVPDFHRQVKAKLLKLAQPSQIVRETTIAREEFLNKAGYPIRGTQDVATVAWNLATGLYYKTQSEPPWKIANMRPGVCYVGLVFKLLPNHPNNHACCAAQMFLSEGDGVVFRGANGPWQTENKEFHLSGASAKALIQTVLDTYRAKFDCYPKELFIHGTTSFDENEWSAFQEAAPEGTDIIAIRIKNTFGDMKLYREGDYPCLRGTAVKLNDENAFLWTSGYAPRIDTYLGPETPNPLFITVLKSTGSQPDLKLVLSDILALTKINYNACNYCDSEPITIKFAQKVGDILVMGSAKDAERQPFKFYV